MAVLLGSGEGEFDFELLTVQRICCYCRFNGLTVASDQVGVRSVSTYNRLAGVPISAGCACRLIPRKMHFSLNPRAIQRKLEAISTVFEMFGAAVEIRADVDILILAVFSG